MADDKLAELLKTQKSLTEWLEDIGQKDTKRLRHEDVEKRARLKQVHDIIGLPFDEPIQFAATAVRDNTPEFQAYLTKHGQDLCVLHLLPNEPSLPKIRMRGKTITGAVEWFFEQDIDAAKYRASFAPHPPDYS